LKRYYEEAKATIQIRDPNDPLERAKYFEEINMKNF
jgi:hypothetical protein